MLEDTLLFVMLRLKRKDALPKVVVLLKDRLVAAHDLIDLGRVLQIRCQFQPQVVDLTFGILLCTEWCGRRAGVRLPIETAGVACNGAKQAALSAVSRCYFIFLRHIFLCVDDLGESRVEHRVLNHRLLAVRVEHLFYNLLDLTHKAVT